MRHISIVGRSDGGRSGHEPVQGLSRVVIRHGAGRGHGRAAPIDGVPWPVTQRPCAGLMSPSSYHTVRSGVWMLLPVEPPSHWTNAAAVTMQAWSNPTLWRHCLAQFSHCTFAFSFPKYFFNLSCLLYDLSFNVKIQQTSPPNVDFGTITTKINKHRADIARREFRNKTRGQSNLTKSASRGAHSPVRGHPRGSKVVPLNSWGRVSY